MGADEISSDFPLLNVDDLAEQVAEVLDFFGYVNACPFVLAILLSSSFRFDSLFHVFWEN